MEEQSKLLKANLVSKKAQVQTLSEQLEAIKYNQKEQAAEIESETERLNAELEKIDQSEISMGANIDSFADVLLRIMDGINGLTLLTCSSSSGPTCASTRIGHFHQLSRKCTMVCSDLFWPVFLIFSSL